MSEERSGWEWADWINLQRPYTPSGVSLTDIRLPDTKAGRKAVQRLLEALEGVQATTSEGKPSE